MEPEPPTDCGALSQEDLEGLLGETWMDCEADAFGDGSIPIKPSDMWFALRYCLGDSGAEHRPFVTDFYADGPGSTEDIEWNYPVHAYDIQFDVNEQISPCFAWGIMTLDYEDHVYGVHYAPRQAWYWFWCYVYPTPSGWSPYAHTGGWGECHGPGDPPITTAPQNALLPQRRMEEVRTRNPHIDYDSIKRVIEHKTIVLDDEYGGRVNQNDPAWEQRPGYAGSCWAAPGTGDHGLSFYITWGRHSSYPLGMYDFYIYKTPPSGADVLDDRTQVDCYDYYSYDHVDQSVPPFDVWQYVKTVEVRDDWEFAGVSGFDADPLPCMVYFDAMKME
jgi:hypothetical protein